MKILIGQVTDIEKKEIQLLFERKNGLTELAKVLTIDNSELYEKLIKDMGETNIKFQEWWDNTARKYKWIGRERGHWEIDFITNKIYLVE